MNEIISAGGRIGVIGFVAVVAFLLCCTGTLALMGLLSWIIRMIGGMIDEDHDTHTD